MGYISRKVISLIKYYLSSISSLLFPSRRIIRWELPRLLSAVERLDNTIRREIAVQQLEDKDIEKTLILMTGMSRNLTTSIKLESYRINEIRRQVDELTTISNRIKGLLGYK